MGDGHYDIEERNLSMFGLLGSDSGAQDRGQERLRELL